jgi:CheY-like chemotaxis protein
MKVLTTMLLENRRIFVIEDNLENRMITRITLNQHGARMEFDSWGIHVLAHLRAFAPVDVIIVDLMFPNGVTGYKLFEDIRKEIDYTDVPIVAVSAADPNTAIPRCREMGFAGFIAKPIDDELFPEQIASIIEGKQVWYANSI